MDSLEKHVIFPGTFNPITLGHVDLVNRALKLFSQLTLAIFKERKSTDDFLNEEERLRACQLCFKHYKKVNVVFFDGLLVDLVKEINACAVLRGIRTIADFNYEMKMNCINKELNHAFETILLPSQQKFLFCSSSIVKKIAEFDINQTRSFLPEIVFNILKEKYSKNQKDFLV